MLKHVRKVVVKFVGLLLLTGLVSTNSISFTESFGASQISWSGWTRVPGDMFSDSAPAATVYRGEIWLFVKGPGQRIYFNRFNFREGIWSGWSEVPGGGTTDEGPAVTVGNDGVLWLFVKGIEERRLYVNAFYGSGWSGWSEVPGNGTTNAAPAAESDLTGSVFLFVKGIDDRRIYVNEKRGSWSGWYEVPGGGTTDVALGATFCGYLHLFAKGIGNGRIYLNVLAGSSGWSEVPGDGVTDQPIAATCNDQETGIPLYVFVKGIEDKGVYVNRRAFFGGSWSGWSLVPGLQTLGLAATSDVQGKIYVFAAEYFHLGINMNIGP